MFEYKRKVKIEVKPKLKLNKKICFNDMLNINKILY